MSDWKLCGFVPVRQSAMVIVLLLWMVEMCFGGPSTSEHDSSEFAQPGSFELAAGVVVDTRLPAVFLMAPGGGIEAIDPRTGELLWGSNAAARPLLAIDGRLVAQEEFGASTAGVLALVFLDTRNGGKSLLRVEAPIPPNVLPLVDQRLGTSFSLRAREHGKDIVLTWNYLEKHVMSVAPPPGSPPFRQQKSGALSIDVGTGKVTQVADPGETAVRPMPASIQRLLDIGELRQAPWLSGEVFWTTVEKADEQGVREVFLRRWQATTGTLLPDVLLLDEPAVARMPSADRRHLMTSSMLSVRGAGGERYLWSIFAITSGTKLGTLRQLYSTPPFCVLGDLMLHQSLPIGRRVDGEWTQEPVKLRAIDLETGIERWSRAVRDTAYRGPPPPSQ